MTDNSENDWSRYGHKHSKSPELKLVNNDEDNSVQLQVEKNNEINLTKVGIYLGATSVAFSCGVYLVSETLQPKDQIPSTIASLSTGLGLTAIYVFAPQIDKYLVRPFNNLVNRFKS